MPEALAAAQCTACQELLQQYIIEFKIKNKGQSQFYPTALDETSKFEVAQEKLAPSRPQ